MPRVAGWFAVTCVAVSLVTAAAPATRAAAPTPEQLRQFLQTVTVRIDVEAPAHRGVCTGWVGWTETGRSAVYTAAHCYRPEARYHLVLSGGDTVYSTGHARWDAVDLMALWLPRGHLPVLRAWKFLPGAPFRALYVLSDRGTTVRQVEVAVPRVLWEIRFENHPQAVALPIASLPGTSGSPIVDLADGLLVGMVVGFLEDRPEVAAVIPASQIYETLLAASRTPRQPATGSAPQPP